MDCDVLCICTLNAIGTYGTGCLDIVATIIRVIMIVLLLLLLLLLYFSTSAFDSLKCNRLPVNQTGSVTELNEVYSMSG